MKTEVKPPADCTPDELAAFESLLCASGETASPTLAGRILNAERLAFFHAKDGVLAAGAALKLPRAVHCAGVFKRAVPQTPPEDYAFELGWVAIGTDAPEDAACDALVSALLEHAGSRGVFALLRSDRQPLCTALERHDLRLDGAPYPSPRGSYSLALHVRRRRDSSPKVSFGSPG